VLVVIGVSIRALTMIAYSPALFFVDSWGYLSYAYPRNGALVSLPWLRPAGYSLLIRLFASPGRNMVQLVAIQHLCGVLLGVIVYVVLTRLRLSRWTAAAAASLILLDGYSITLEQYVMADTFFTVTLVAALLLLMIPVSPRLRIVRAAVVGALLAFSALEREVAIFVLPVPVVYLIWTRSGWRQLLTFLLVATIPLIGYSALVDAKYKRFGLTAASGWMLYGRVAGFANCNGARIPRAAEPLCETAAQRRSHPDGPDWYIWGPSPAAHLFAHDQATVAGRANDDTILQEFARAIAVHQPWNLAAAALTDFAHYFTPGVTPPRDASSATSLPTTPAAEASDASAQSTVLPHLRPEIRSPAGVVRAYRRAVHVPRPVLALLAIAAVLGLALKVPGRREIFLLVGSAIVLLLSTAATAGFGLRYLLPAVPLLAIGGTLAGTQCAARFRTTGGRMLDRAQACSSDRGLEQPIDAPLTAYGGAE
jgi:4-amino-4-deoxy-L-arabinose transferase-like glycosyltransferase